MICSSRLFASRALLGAFLAVTLSGVVRAQPHVMSRKCPGVTGSDTTRHGAGKLVVIVPGLDDDTDSWTSLIRRLSTEEDDFKAAAADYLCIDHGLSAMSRRSTSEVVRAVHASIDARWHMHHGYSSVVLVGHSAGGVLVRAAQLMGLGAFAGDSVTRSAWASNVSRVVLFAGINRGVKLGGPLPTAFADAAERVFGIGGDGYVFQSLLRGSPFIANTRISWLRWHETERETARLADSVRKARGDSTMTKPGCGTVIVQLLGVRDEIVAADDSRDVMTLPCALQIYVPQADHGDLPTLEGTDNPDERYAELRRGFLASRRDLEPPAQDRKVEQVVFMLHGIRSGTMGWQQVVKESMQGDSGYAPSKIRFIQPDYGYFTALNFLSSYQRDRHLARILDEIAEARWRYPRAEFDVVAHSNGTYLLGEALKLVPAVRFRHIYLAGSPLSPEYDWKRIKERGQAEIIVNADGEADWAVAILGSAVRTLGNRRIGAAGVVGFVGTDTHFLPALPGEHGAAFADSVLPHLNRFLRRGDLPCLGVEGRRSCGITRATELRLEKYQGYARATPYVVQAVGGGLLYTAWRDVYHEFRRPAGNPDMGRALLWLGGVQAVRIFLSII